jgi:hypothetical protein
MDNFSPKLKKHTCFKQKIVNKSMKIIEIECRERKDDIGINVFDPNIL